MLKENDKIKVHMYAFGKEIQTRNKDEVYTIYKKNGNLGIDWNTEKKQTTSNGDAFVSLNNFSFDVVFENVDTRKKYHWCNAENKIVEVV